MGFPKAWLIVNQARAAVVEATAATHAVAASTVQATAAVVEATTAATNAAAPDSSAPHGRRGTWGSRAAPLGAAPPRRWRGS